MNYVETIRQGEYGLDGFAYVVHGGDDAEICETIQQYTQNCNGLIGNVECNNNCFNSIRFQRPMPVIIDVTACLPVDCPPITAAQAEQFIRNTESSITRSNKIRSCDFSKAHPEIDDVTFNVTFPPLITCEGGQTYTDPIDGSEIDFYGTNYCGGIPNDCAQCSDGPLLSLIHI